MSLRYPIVPTPLVRLDRLGQQLSLNLYSKRDDLFFLSGGGSKARKLHYILNSKTLGNFNAIVTAGDSQSNHLRATALFASKLGLKLICIVHSKKPEIYEGNLKITLLSGAELRFVEKDDVKIAMDTAMDDLRRSGFTPLYIWGGGHCVEGSLAYYDAAKELADQAINLSPEFIVLASGTGTTQAGLEVGVREYLPDCRVLGVSVSRSEQKGKSVIFESMNELIEFLGKPIKLPESLFLTTDGSGPVTELFIPSY